MTERDAQARAEGLLPGYLTADLPGIGGRARATPEDFVVEELPLYGPTGQGQHTLFGVEKRGIGTRTAMARIAAALGISTRMLSSAGLKDADAVTRQSMSVEGVDPQRLLALDLPDLCILWAERHRNRLKIGHLKGNRFCLRIRDVGPDAVEPARRIVGVLAAHGVPNGFGPQRFGLRSDSHLLGRALLRNDVNEFLSLYLGRPCHDDVPPVRRARELFDEGDLAGALDAWPRADQAERQTLTILAQGRGAAVAVRQVQKWLKRLLIAAYQSYLFNQLLQERLPHLGALEVGDLAVKHVNGAFFTVEDAPCEQPRADRLEISPSGPLYSHKVHLATGDPGQRERELLAREDLQLEDWRVRGIRLDGARRPFRVPLSDVDVCYDDGVVLTFALPAGAYASNVLGEVMKLG